MNRTKIDIIIPTYNRPDDLKRCLESLSVQTFPKSDFNVIVVDDGSPQDLKSIIDAFSDKLNITYIKKKKQEGPASARNEGLKQANASIIAFTDDHCVLDKNWLSEIYKGFTKNPDISCVKGKTLALDPNDFAKLCEVHIYGSKKSHATNNIAYRKEVFKNLGGFDTRFKDAAGEDVDLKWRFLKAGYKRLYLEDMIVYHPHEDSIKAFRRKGYRTGNGRAVFLKKYIFKRPLLAIGGFIYDIRYFPLSWYYLLFKRNMVSPLSVKAIYSAFILKGFVEFFVRK